MSAINALVRELGCLAWWPGVGEPVLAGARRVGLPAGRDKLAALLADSGHPAHLAAALVRVSLSHRAAAEVTARVST